MFAVFKEFDKNVTGNFNIFLSSRYNEWLTEYSELPIDLFSDDFDSKYSLKVKSAGPHNAVCDCLFNILIVGFF